jgi:hypothetical protein
MGWGGVVFGCGLCFVVVWLWWGFGGGVLLGVFGVCGWGFGGCYFFFLIVDYNKN